MKIVMVDALAFILGVCTGIISGLSLIRQITLLTSQPSPNVSLYPVFRIVSIALLSWSLLHWGPVAFILFGIGMLIALWVVIITLNR